MSSTKISARHALTQKELDFCRIYAGFDFSNPSEAWRRAFHPDLHDSETGAYHPDPSCPKPASVAKRVAALLDKAHIQAYLAELKGDASDRARGVLAEQAHFGEGADAQRAAMKILESEDKLKFRDAVENWAEILCAIGTEVVVPLPGGGEVAFPFREMFPRYAEALPPVDVLRKTEQTLREYRESLEEPDRAQEEERREQGPR